LIVGRLCYFRQVITVLQSAARAAIVPEGA
jgi:hypothetical protein